MEKNVVILNPYYSKNILGKHISQMAMHRKYYNTIKYMVHMSDSRDMRKMMISQISRVNLYLCAQIIMTICEDTKEEESFIIERAENGLNNSLNNSKKSFMLMALLELEQYEKFFDGYAKNRDLLDYEKSRNFFINNLSVKQQLVFLDTLIKLGDLKYFNKFINNLEKKYTNEDKNEVLNFAKKIAQLGYVQYSYDLLKSVNIENNMLSIIEENKDSFEKYFSEKTSFSRTNEFDLFLMYKYNIFSKTINNLELWDCFFKDSEWKYDFEFFRFSIRNYSKRNYLNVQTILYFLDKLGVDKRFYSEESAKDYLFNYLKSRNPLSIEPFSSSIRYEDKMIALLDSPNFINRYEFNLERLDINTNLDSNQKNEYYKYFDECFLNYKNVENIIRVYFNTPIKKIVDIEYLIFSLIDRFNCDEKRLKYLLGDYNFKGRVCRVNEKSVSIRAYNVLTANSCRMNIIKYWVNDENGHQHKLEVGDILFFKFAYISREGKINVHYPELSYEKLQEKEALRRKRYDS